MNYLRDMLLNNKSKKKLIIELLFLISIIISSAFELIFSEFGYQRLLNFTENILFALILIIPLSFLNSKKPCFFYFNIVFVFFNIILFFETSYYYIFNVDISPSAIYVLLETNKFETKEFLSFYLDGYIIVYGLFLLLLVIISVLADNKKLLYVKKSALGTKPLVLSLIIVLFVLKATPLRHQNLPYLLLKSFYVVYYESGVINASAYKSEKGIFNHTETANNNKKKLYVVIIGESTTSNNMSLYGYNRKTNPLLSKQEGLSVFKDVISPHAGTTASITKAFSLQDYEQSSTSQGSIIQLLNAANHETYWVSNQEPVGFAETDITKVIKACKNKIYFSTKSSEDTRLYDDVIFDKLDEVINKKENNKILFIHLQGTHIYYKNRYPERFNVFKNNVNNKIISKAHDFEIINEYDNAVLYNDYIVNTIIQKIKHTNNESFVLYFSDHGEEVYHTIKFVGHNDDVGTLPMFQIPFMLWQSETFKKNNSIEIDLDRPYMTDDLFHSIAHLCDVSNKHVNLKKSIFSKSFKKRKRIILNNKDYDSLYVIENKKKN
ncbi:phosphoethanolamine transferase [Wocania ichthyoenteri]|uniref:phosphoethanolamine transferase n=1 Tax=Wocania ichthyoenteri TaxID=1230531 RepID=UPI00138E0D86|nr:phosphoethanolamine transferase [Wocania ichthyoenteri]